MEKSSRYNRKKVSIASHTLWVHHGVPGWKRVHGTIENKQAELVTCSVCVTEFTVGKEFTVRQELMVQQKKSKQSRPHVVRA